LSAFVAKRMGIPVFHMEAGNRCYDDRVPEEVNRRVIDHCSDVLMPYTERSRYNLLREGISNSRIFVTGNPIKEILDYYSAKIDDSKIVSKLGLKKNGYFLVTLHRAENVDIPDRLAKFVKSFRLLHQKYGVPVVCSLHPRTRSKLEKFSLMIDGDGVIALEPLGLFDFVNLEKNAICVLTDSGTVQEECCLFNVPNVTLRDVTERPETLEAGSNILSGGDPENILSCVNVALKSSARWVPPDEYLSCNVSETAAKIILGYNHSLNSSSKFP
jgi:UDP-N-acetylglucosamine 2-epimerase (non-hydrolysing)